MLRIMAALLLVAATAVAAGAIRANVDVSIPYYPCNTTIRGMRTVDLVKYSGTWFDVSMSLKTPNYTTPEKQQKIINDQVGCARGRFDLSNAKNLTLTQDLIFRQKINDTTVFPPDAVITGNEVRYPVPAHGADSNLLNDAHWIEELYTNLGKFSVDVYTIATNYKDWSVWYLCTAPPNQPQIEQWGVYSRSPKQLNPVEKLAFKALARLGGVNIAFSDNLYDFPQDLCF